MGRGSPAPSLAEPAQLMTLMPSCSRGAGVKPLCPTPRVGGRRGARPSGGSSDLPTRGAAGWGPPVAVGDAVACGAPRGAIRGLAAPPAGTRPAGPGPPPLRGTGPPRGVQGHKTPGDRLCGTPRGQPTAARPRQGPWQPPTCSASPSAAHPPPQCTPAAVHPHCNAPPPSHRPPFAMPPPEPQLPPSRTAPGSPCSGGASPLSQLGIWSGPGARRCTAAPASGAARGGGAFHGGGGGVGFGAGEH